VPLASLTTDNGYVVNGAERHPYGDFLATAAGLSLPSDTPLRAKPDFKFIGKERIRIDALAKSTGTAVYGIDADVPGLHYAVVRRSPVAGARLKAVDKSQAENMPGVTDVIEISSGVAVVAKSFWQAKKAAQTLAPEWEEVALSKRSTADIAADYEAAIQTGHGNTAQSEGDVAATLEAAADVHTSDFWTPYLAHAPLEPMNATLRIEDGKADLWTGTQGPGGAQGLVARFSGIAPENITVHSSYLGGGFGRRGTLTHVIEVTEIVMAAEKPVQLTWTREDDIRHGYYRPASHVRISATLADDGTIAGWRAQRAGGDMTPETLKNMLPALFPGMGDGTRDFIVDLANDVFSGFMPDPSSIEGLAEGYDLPNREVEAFSIDHGLPLTFWRSVGHSNNAFSKEVMMDELAERASMDAVEFRLANSKNNPRLHNVIRIAGERMQAMTPPAGHYLGFAAHGSFNTDVAEIAEISVENGQIRVHKITCVVDCGTAVTPDIVRAQMEGGVRFGLTAALYGEPNLENGEVVESNFHNYPILRINEAPEVDVIIVESDDDPTGVGEPGVPPIAPAVANAVYAATGQRLRSLPLKLA